MKAIKCELCGFHELTKRDGYYVCNACGTKYTLEDARKLIINGTVEIVRGNAECDRIIGAGDKFLSVNDIPRALEQYQKALEEFPEIAAPYERMLNVVVTKGCALCPVSPGSKQLKLMKGTKQLIERFEYIYRGYTAIAEEPADISEFQEKFYESVKNGQIVITTLQSYREYDYNDSKGELFSNDKELLCAIENYLSSMAGKERAKELMDDSENCIRSVRKYHVKSSRGNWKRKSFFEELGYVSAENTDKSILFWIDECVFCCGKTLIVRGRIIDSGSYSRSKHYYHFCTMQKSINEEDLALAEKTAAEYDLYRERKSKNLCINCGGKLKGIFNPVCTVCGKKQN